MQQTTELPVVGTIKGLLPCDIQVHAKSASTGESIDINRMTEVQMAHFGEIKEKLGNSIISRIMS